jgi:uncharacterized protein YfiM (DUF2279 family)
MYLGDDGAQNDRRSEPVAGPQLASPGEEDAAEQERIDQQQANLGFDSS